MFGLTTCAAAYLACERLLRPVVARALASSHDPPHAPRNNPPRDGHALEVATPVRRDGRRALGRGRALGRVVAIRRAPLRRRPTSRKHSRTFSYARSPWKRRFSR